MRSSVWIYFLMALSIVDCKTSSSNKKIQSVLDQKLSPIKESIGIKSITTSASSVVGEILTVDSITVDETHADNKAAIKITANKSEDADFVRIWICEKDNLNNCTITLDKAKESASGEIYIYEIPAKIITIYALACAETKNAVSPERPCGHDVTSQDFVSSVMPLNSPEITETLQKAQEEEQKIQEQCSKIEATARDYNAKDDSGKDPDVVASTENIEGISNEHVCAELMTDTQIPLASGKSNNSFYIALGLGSVSVLFLAAGIHGNVKLMKDLKLQKDAKGRLEGLKKTESALKTRIKAQEKEVLLLEEEIRRMTAESTRLEADLKKSETEQSAAEAEIERLKGQIASVKASGVDLEGELKENEKTLLENESKRVKIEEAITSRKKDIEAKTAALEREKVNLVDLHKTEERLGLKVKQYEAIAEKEGKEKNLPQSKLDKLSENVRRIEGEVGILEKSLKESGELSSRNDAIRRKFYKKSLFLDQDTFLKALDPLMFEAIKYQFPSPPNSISSDDFNKLSPSKKMDKFLEASNAHKTSWVWNTAKQFTDVMYMLQLNSKTLDVLNFSITELKTYYTNQDLLSTREETRTELTKKREELSAYKDELEKISAEHKELSEKIKNLNEEIADLDRRISDIKVSSAHPDKTIVEAKTAVELTRKNIIEKLDLIKSLEAEKQKLQETEKTISDELQSSKAVKEELGKQKLNLAEQIKQNQEELRQLNDSLVEEQKHKDSIAEEIATKQTALEAEKVNLGNLPAKQAEFKTAQDRLNASNAEKSKIPTTEAEIRARQSRIRNSRIQMGVGFAGFIAGAAAAVAVEKFNLTDSPENELQSGFESAIDSIRQSQNTINQVWEQLSP